MNNNKYIYPNNISDIDQFIEKSPKHVVQNEHDGLMLFISSHIDRDEVIYDGESEIYT